MPWGRVLRGRGGRRLQDDGGPRPWLRVFGLQTRERLQLGAADRHDVAGLDRLATADLLSVEEGPVGGSKVLDNEPLVGEIEPCVPAGQRLVVAEAANWVGSAAEYQAADRDFDPAALLRPGHHKQGHGGKVSSVECSHDFSVPMAHA
jgi:hypothetical protein